MCRTFQSRLPQQGLLAGFPVANGLPQNGLPAPAKAPFLLAGYTNHIQESVSTAPEVQLATQQSNQRLSLPHAAAHGPVSILPSMDFSAFTQREQNPLQPKRKIEVVGLLGDPYQMHGSGKYMLVPCDQVTFQPKQDSEFIDPEVDASRMAEATEGGTHRASCHRCGNMRKKNELCNRCPQTFCSRCAEKMRDEHGPSVFSTGCPVCKGLCCCGKNKSVACMRKYHCYKKCPCTKKPSKSAMLYGPSLADVPTTLNQGPCQERADFTLKQPKLEESNDSPMSVVPSDYLYSHMSADMSYQPQAPTQVYSPVAETTTSEEDGSEDCSHDTKRRKILEDDSSSFGLLLSPNSPPALNYADTVEQEDDDLVALLSDEAFVAALGEFGEFFATEGI